MHPNDPEQKLKPLNGGLPVTTIYISANLKAAWNITAKLNEISSTVI